MRGYRQQQHAGQDWQLIEAQVTESLRLELGAHGGGLGAVDHSSYALMLQRSRGYLTDVRCQRCQQQAARLGRCLGTCV